ncbi:CcmD family protein [Mucilaginibacter lacusdianchii]|uniref:CcmD family protein n=1 Tax=Mucilaginibacter lacusdianchii TaxID=2684211 RepID=UPI00131B720F|nr:CcmD family protein [Mucilaginibacter sp. JXJ CY 39]
MKKLGLLALTLFCGLGAFAQPVEMADKMRSSGQIYVVIATVAIVFAGLAVYLFAMDRRLKKLEKQD